MRTAVYSDYSDYGLGKNKYHNTDPGNSFIKSREFRNLYQIDQDRDLIDPIAVDGSKQPNEPIATDLQASIKAEQSGEAEQEFWEGIYGTARYNNKRRDSSLPMTLDNAHRILYDTIERESSDPIRIQLKVGDYSADPLLMRAIDKEMDVTGDTIIDETSKRSQDFRSSVSKSIRSFSRENNLFKSNARKQMEASRLQNYANKGVENLVGDDLSEAGKILLKDILSSRYQTKQQPPDVTTPQATPFGSGTTNITQTKAPPVFNTPIPPPLDTSSATRSAQPMGSDTIKSISKSIDSLFPQTRSTEGSVRLDYMPAKDIISGESKPSSSHIVRKNYGTTWERFKKGMRDNIGNSVWF